MRKALLVLLGLVFATFLVGVSFVAFTLSNAQTYAGRFVQEAHEVWSDHAPEARIVQVTPALPGDFMDVVDPYLKRIGTEDEVNEDVVRDVLAATRREKNSFYTVHGDPGGPAGSPYRRALMPMRWVVVKAVADLDKVAENGGDRAVLARCLDTFAVTRDVFVQGSLYSAALGIGTVKIAREKCEERLKAMSPELRKEAKAKLKAMRAAFPDPIIFVREDLAYSTILVFSPLFRETQLAALPADMRAVAENLARASGGNFLAPFALAYGWKSWSAYNEKALLNARLSGADRTAAFGKAIDDLRAGPFVATTGLGAFDYSNILNKWDEEMATLDHFIADLSSE